MGDRENWELRHAAGGRQGDRERPDAFVLEALDSLADGRGRDALDLAAGRGRHALELARRGWLTNAWDRSVAAGRVLAQHARVAGLEIAWRTVDLTDPDPLGTRGEFDLVVLVNYLDRELLGQMASMVRAGGHVIFVSFTKERPGEHPREDFCLEPGELEDGLPGFVTLVLREAGGRAGILARRE